MKRTRRLGRIACFVVILLAAGTVPARGWGRDGHCIVADIAARLLTEKTRAAIAELLGTQTLADVSTWADAVRDQPAYRFTAPFHYVNVPADAETFDAQRDCPESGCAVSAIRRYSEVLRDPAASKDQRVEALKFVVHFVGDLHQPLHAGLARDRGGNDIAVELFHNRRNLHEVWDTDLLAIARKPWKAAAEELYSTVSDAKRLEWRSQDPEVWATESHKLAMSCAYKVPSDGKLDQAYVDRSLPVVHERLAAAGVRLAGLLNSIFDPDSTHGEATQDRREP